MSRFQESTALIGLHQACYQGDLARVRELIERGADVNARASAEEEAWISCAEGGPRPLNCLAIAWAVTPAHVEIARLLLAHGAVVDESVGQDLTVEMVLSEHDQELMALFSAHLASS